jgi:hypothetical protein
MSKFTGRTKRLPAALGLMGAKGSDVAPAQIVSDFLEEDEALREVRIAEAKRFTACWYRVQYSERTHQRSPWS